MTARHLDLFDHKANNTRFRTESLHVWNAYLSIIGTCAVDAVKRSDFFLDMSISGFNLLRCELLTFLHDLACERALIAIGGDHLLALASCTCRLLPVRKPLIAVLI